MEYSDLMDISQDAIYTYLKISLPILCTALVIGLIISLFQALTQIQEATLTFVPKMIAIFVCLMLIIPYMGNHLKLLVEHIEFFIIHPDGDMYVNKDAGKEKLENSSSVKNNLNKK